MVILEFNLNVVSLVLVLGDVCKEHSDLLGSQLCVHYVICGVLIWVSLGCLLRCSKQMTWLAGVLGGSCRNLLLVGWWTLLLVLLRRGLLLNSLALILLHLGMLLMWARPVGAPGQATKQVTQLLLNLLCLFNLNLLLVSTWLSNISKGSLTLGGKTLLSHRLRLSLLLRWLLREASLR